MAVRGIQGTILRNGNEFSGQLVDFDVHIETRSPGRTSVIIYRVEDRHHLTHLELRHPHDYKVTKDNWFLLADYILDMSDRPQLTTYAGPKVSVGRKTSIGPRFFSFQAGRPFAILIDDIGERRLDETSLHQATVFLSPLQPGDGHISVQYNQKRLVVRIVRKTKGEVTSEEYIGQFSNDLSDEELMELYIRGFKAFKPSADRFIQNRYDNPNPTKLYPASIGEFTYLQSYDGKVRVTWQADPVVIVTRAVFEAIDKLGTPRDQDWMSVVELHRLKELLSSRYIAMTKVAMKQDNPVNAVLNAALEFAELFKEHAKTSLITPSPALVKDVS
jgi:hypothetical protein